MKTKSLLIVALMSLFTLAASAATDSVVVSYLGTNAENLLDTVNTYTVGDEIVVKALFSNPTTATDVTIDLLNDEWGAAPGTASTYTVPADGNIDVIYTVPDEAPLSFFPDSTNKEIRLRVMISYPDGKAFSFHRINTYPKDGVYPEIIVSPKVSDILHVTLTVETEDTSYVQGEQKGWTNMNYKPQPGDYLHFQGTYDVSLGDTAFATRVEFGINYLLANWSPGPFLHYSTPASIELGNMDGIIDFRMKIPYFVPENILWGNETFDAATMHPFISFQVMYSGKPVLEDFSGKLGTNNAKYQWWGFLGDYEGDKPTLCTEITGISATALSDTNVVIIWDDSDEAIWQIAMAEAGSVRSPEKAPIKLETKSLPVVISGLEPGTDYTVWVRSVCDPDPENLTVGDYVQMDGSVTTPGSSSLFSSKADDQVNLFPNPTSGKLTITASEAYVISVCDLSGREMLRTNMVTPTQDLDLTSMKNGIYLIHFSNNEKSFAKTFIKQ